MPTNPLQPAGRRFIQKFGVSFFWALIFGGLFGGLAWFRVDFSQMSGEPAWHQVPRLWLAKLEHSTYDWRLRELAERSNRSDDVVMVRVDEETATNARASPKTSYAMRPWPRDLLGAVADQLILEKATVAVLDVPLNDASSHACEPCRGEKRVSDDALLAQHSAMRSGQVIATVVGAARAERPADRPLTPLLVNVAGPQVDRFRAVAQVLSLGWPAFVDGSGLVWAGTDGEASAKKIHAAFAEAPAFSTRAQVPGDLEQEVTRNDVTVHNAEVKVDGLETEGLLKVRSVDGPMPEVLQTGVPLGLDFVSRDVDGQVRRVRLLALAVDRNGTTHVLATAPLRAVMAHAQTTVLRFSGSELKIGDRYSVPMAADGTMRLVFDDDPGRSGSTNRRVIPAWRVLLNLEDTQASRGVLHHDNELGDRVVVFSDERDASDVRVEHTPIGELGHAALLTQAIVGLLHSQTIQRVPPETDFWLTAAFALAGALLAVAWSTALKRAGWLIWAGTLTIVACAHLFVARQIFVEQFRWVAVAAPLLACGATFLASLGYARSLEKGLRDFVLRALGGAVRADVFQRVERDLALMKPERRQLTIYFSDIEGFTQVAQQQEPQFVVESLRKHLDAMTALVLRSKGHVDKYLGDGLMAFWGAPVALTDQVTLACEAALLMRDAFEVHRAELEKKLGQRLKLRAGIDAGPSVVGEMGTAHRVNYTVMGESVATSFRLESVAKRYHASIVVSETVVAQAGPRFVFREVDVLRLGRPAVATRVFELLGEVGATTVETDRLSAHVAAMELYHQRKFAEAEAAFTVVTNTWDDALALLLKQRCEQLKRTPPPPEWDGAWPVQSDDRAS